MMKLKVENYGKSPFPVREVSFTSARVKLSERMEN